MTEPNEKVLELISKIDLLNIRVSSVDIFLTDFANKQTYPPSCEIKTRIATIEKIQTSYEKIWEDFSNLHVKIEDENDFKEKLFAFDEYIQKITGDLIYLRDKYQDDKDEDIRNAQLQFQSQFQIPNNTPKPKIPNLTITPFDGNPTQWLSFKESCEVVFHLNPNIEDIHKFAYLRKLLKDDALAKIEGIHITASGYAKAWEELCSHYDRKRVIIEHHIDALLNIRTMTKDTFEELNALLNTCITNVSSLEAYGYIIDGLSEIMIIHAISKRFTIQLKKEWEGSLEEDELPSFKMIKSFIMKHCRILKAAEMNKSISKPEYKPNVNFKPNANFKPKIMNSPYKKPFNSNNQSRTPQSFIVSETQSLNSKPNTSRRCVFCSAPFHPFIYCPEFQKLSISERYNKIIELNLCLNCFGSNHRSKDCQKLGCKKCSMKHHTMIHRDKPDRPIPEKSINNVQQPSTSTNVSSFTVQNEVRKAVLLPTAIVYIQDKFNNYHECRALIDSGSQSNFVSSDLLKRIPFDKLQITNTSVSGLSQNKTDICESITANIKSVVSEYEENLQFLVVPKISEALPQQTIDLSRWKIPRSIILSDPYFNTSRPVDILLGAEIFFNILTSNKITIPKLPIFQETLLGWIVNGKYEQGDKPTHNFSIFCDDSQQNSNTDTDLNRTVQKFWEIESIPKKMIVSKEEQKCEDIFVHTHTRDETGRYVVSLPLKDTVENLGESKSQALKRFKSLEYRLNQNPKLKSDYTDFVHDYIDRGHMRMLNPSEESVSEMSYYLPHHAVIKPSSSTTKLRVVFDASMKTSTNLSLNDVMMVGPTVQPNLFNTVLRFRKNVFALTSDISKMYRQVKICPEHSPLQRILWRSNTTEPVRIYELTTVTYGTAAAPYLATRVLNQLADDEREKYPLAAQVVKRDFYVDDVLTGANTIEDATLLQTELINMLSAGGFKLHKWASNSAILIENIPPENREILKSDETSDQEYIGTLGLHWKPKDDIFIFNIKVPNLNNQIITKRSALSDAARLYDPLGFVSPCTVIAKLFIQSMWEIKSDWDQQLPDELAHMWQDYLSKLPELNRISLPRCVVPPNPKSFEIHGFSDASTRAYGCCVYIKTVDENNESHVHLLCSKSRVAPKGFVSVPRLELCAALVLSELIVVVLESLEIANCSVNLWSDSTIVLQWLKIEPSKLKTFVANRVSQIQELTKNFTWRHVRTNENPADLVSRGIMPIELQNADIWWFGPHFLKTLNCNFEGYVAPETVFNEEQLELKKETVSLISVSAENKQFDLKLENFSSFTRVIRVIAQMLRFKQRCLSKMKNEIKSDSLLSVDELNTSRIRLLVYIQKIEFKADYVSLLTGKLLSPKSHLICLNPFIEENTGLIRVGGRLENSKLHYDLKHQIVLPKHHHLTDLIFRYYHLKNLHAGPQLLVSIVRQTYWPIHAKNSAKKIIKQCVTCFKLKPILSSQLMGSLPSERIDIQKPFFTTGTDLCGPFYVRHKFQRNKSPTKVYVASFVCFVTKAIHLEVLSDLSSDCFIACLKRFIFRRGKCHTLWSDNATNFVGSDRQLKKEFEEFMSEITTNEIREFCTAESINWKFIPPRAPNFGGLWESTIKSFKFHLKRVTHGMSFTLEELNTLVVQVEGILNSRPLTVLSNDISDPDPLTPAHFLTGGPITAVCEPSCTEIPTNRLTSWKRITKLMQSFWKRFSVEYIHTLQERKKWKAIGPNLKLNDVVLVADDNLPSTNWLLGLVINVVPGKDNKVRVAEIRTKNGVFKRPISKIAKLPIESAE